MVSHLLKEIVGIAKESTDKAKIERVDVLWLQAEGLLVEARKELKTALPYLRERTRKNDPAYLAIIKAQAMLKELDEET